MINYEASDYEKYADELKHLRDQLGEMETLKQSVTELEKRVRESRADTWVRPYGKFQIWVEVSDAFLF